MDRSSPLTFPFSLIKPQCRQKDVDSYALVTTPKNDAPPSETTANAATPAPMVSFAKLFSFADTTDKVLLAIGTLGSMVLGVAQPLQIVFFGNVVNAFNPNAATGDDAFRDSINHTVIQFVIVGAVVLVTGATQIACWNIAAARQTKRLRHAYATAILRQEVGWFDVNEPMQLATRVADTTLIIQEGMGRKVADAINFTTMAITGIAVGFCLRLGPHACASRALAVRGRQWLLHGQVHCGRDPGRRRGVRRGWRCS